MYFINCQENNDCDRFEDASEMINKTWMGCSHTLIIKVHNVNQCSKEHLDPLKKHHSVKIHYKNFLN